MSLSKLFFFCLVNQVQGAVIIIIRIINPSLIVALSGWHALFIHFKGQRFLINCSNWLFTHKPFTVLSLTRLYPGKRKIYLLWLAVYWSVFASVWCGSGQGGMMVGGSLMTVRHHDGHLILAIKISDLTDYVKICSIWI